jgi:hypothetical protein
MQGLRDEHNRSMEETKKAKKASKGKLRFQNDLEANDGLFTQSAQTSIESGMISKLKLGSTQAFNGSLESDRF